MKTQYSLQCKLCFWSHSRVLVVAKYTVTLVGADDRKNKHGGAFCENDISG